MVWEHVSSNEWPHGGPKEIYWVWKHTTDPKNKRPWNPPPHLRNENRRNYDSCSSRRAHGRDSHRRYPSSELYSDDSHRKRHLSMDGKQGGQCIIIGSDILPLHFDGWKCYLQIRQSSQEELKSLPVYELTSPHEYKPQSSFNTRRLSKSHVEVRIQD